MDKTTAAMIKVLAMVIILGIITAVILKPGGVLASGGTGQYVSPYIDQDGTYHSFNTLAELQQYVMTYFPGEPIPIQITWQ